MVPVAAVLFCKVKVLLLPLTVLAKVTVPLPASTVTLLALTVTGALKLIEPPAD